MHRLLIGLLALWPAAAFGQAQWITPSGNSADGAVQMCLNASNQAIACSAAGAIVPSPGSAPVAATVTSLGVNLTTGGVDQIISGFTGARKALVIQNPCSAASQGIPVAESVFVNIGAAASLTANTNFAELAPCQSVTAVITPGVVSIEAWHVIAATTGHTIYAKGF